MSVIEQPSTSAAASTSIAMRTLLATATLARRELVRFVRQPNRIIGAIGQPAVFWILFGAGLGPSFQMPGVEDADVSYREYFFPGTVVLIVLFTAVFTTISIIEDRREGFLQSVLVAPIPRLAMVAGKLIGGTLIAVAQGLLFLLLGLSLGFSFSIPGLFAMLALLCVIGLALTGTGFIIAWRMDSTQGFHAIMSLFLLPMWLLSGAFFPASEGWLGWVVRLNPLTYGVAALRRLLYWNETANLLPPGTPSMTTSVAVTITFAATTFWLAWLVSARRTAGDLR